MIKQTGIAIRLAIFLIIAALGIAFLASEIFYRLTYNAEINDANSSINELFYTVSSTAGIAAFVADEELAKEVVNGLTKSKNVQAASFLTDNISYSVNIDSISSSNAQVYEIKHPFFPEETLGSIHIYPDFERIQSQAKKISRGNSYALYILAVIVTLASIFVCYFLITRPLVTISKKLHEVNPGTSERIPVPSHHNDTEIGSVVADANKLLRNVEYQLKKERSLRKEIEVLEKRFRMLFENATSPIVLLDTDGHLVLFNNAFEKLLESLGLFVNQQNSEFGDLLMELFEEPQALLTSVREAFARDEFATGEYKLKSFSQDQQKWVQIFVSPITTEHQERYYQVTLNDISKRKQELDLLAQQADYDGLTQILNRNGGEKVIRQKMKKQLDFALVLLDLNGFKQINDVHGHDAGDDVLIFVAQQIEKALRFDDVVIRWGGDEFVIVIQNNEINESIVNKIMLKIRKVVSLPVTLIDGETEVSVGLSAGVSFYPNTSYDLTELVKKADEAMYEAKKQKLTNPDDYLRFS